MSLGKVIESLGLNLNGSLPDDLSTAPAGTLAKKLSDDVVQTQLTVASVITAVGLNPNGTAPTGTDVRTELVSEISARTAADAAVQSTAATDATTKANAAQAAAIAASAPIAHVGAGGTAHANATSSVAGFMSATDKALLDGATVSANANSIVKRDANGYIVQLATVARTGNYGDLNGRPTTLVGYGITDVTGISNVMPGDVRNAMTGGAIGTSTLAARADHLHSFTASVITSTLGYTPLNKAGDTLTGQLNLKNYTEAKPAVAYAATINLDLSTGTCFDITLTGNAVFTFSACPNVANTMYSFTLILRQDATGSRLGTFPTNRPQGGTALALTTTASKADIISWMTPDGGITWFTNIAKNY